jgi:putative redox protein
MAEYSGFPGKYPVRMPVKTFHLTCYWIHILQKIKARIGKDHYKTILTSDTHTAVADEPFTSGGTAQGFSPEELLASALAASTALTLRMYEDRKESDLDEIEVEVAVG